MEQNLANIEGRVASAETRIDSLEERVTTHGEEIDTNSAQLHELSIRAQYRDESMGELKAMSRATADALDNLRKDFAEERTENKHRFDSRDAGTYKQLKSILVTAILGGIAGFLLTRIGLG